MNFKNIPKRVGLKNIAVGETVELTLSVPNTNQFGKKQFSGFIGEEHYYLPTHQQLVDKLENIEQGSRVKVTRLTQGGPTEACKYDIEMMESSSPSSVSGSELLPKSEKNDAILATIVSCLLNNASAGTTMMVLRQEFSDDELKDVGL